MIKAAVFDMDGTLLDSMPVWYDAPEVFLRSINVEPEKGLGVKVLSMNMSEGAAYIRSSSGINLTDQQIIDGIEGVVHDAYVKSIPFKPGAREFLERLKDSGTKIALCTNTDRVLFEEAFRRLDAFKYFDLITTATEMKMSKAHPEIFLKVADMLGVKPEDCWLFEDALYSLKTASGTGYKTCAIRDMSYDDVREEINKVSTVHFDSFYEVMKYFFEQQN